MASFLSKLYCNNIRITYRQSWLFIICESSLRVFFAQDLVSSWCKLTSGIGIIRTRIESCCRNCFLDDNFLIPDYRFYWQEFQICCSFRLFCLFILLTLRHLFYYNIFTIVELYYRNETLIFLIPFDYRRLLAIATKYEQ